MKTTHGRHAMFLLVVVAAIGQSQAQRSAARGQKERASLKGHGEIVESIAFSPDGKILVSASRDNAVKLWDLSAGKVKASFSEEIGGSPVAFSPDGKVIAHTANGVVKLRDVESGKEIRLLHGHDKSLVHCMEFSPDGKTLAAGGSDGIIAWDVVSGETTLKLKVEDARSLAFSPDGKKLLSGSEGILKEGELNLWDVATGKPIATLERRSKGYGAVAFGPDGRTVAGGDRFHETVKLWDVTTGKSTSTLVGRKYSGASSLAFSPDGKMLASGGYGLDGTVILWDTTTGKTLATLGQDNSYSLPCVAFSRDGKTLAAASQDKTIKLWDVPTVNK
jgi:WD40 repeat protein